MQGSNWRAICSVYVSIYIPLVALGGANDVKKMLTGEEWERQAHYSKEQGLEWECW